MGTALLRGYPVVSGVFGVEFSEVFFPTIRPSGLVWNDASISFTYHLTDFGGPATDTFQYLIKFPLSTTGRCPLSLFRNSLLISFAVPPHSSRCLAPQDPVIWRSLNIR